ncbi:hypothetical protein EV424DRAFT_1472195 [Suillus variegatus]|nr:hypothetical protein EV424DRAFT_1472195 [Suillus variegatus]
MSDMIEGQVNRPEILDVIETSIDGLSGELRMLSLDIHEYCRRYAHDAYTAFMEKHGFTVIKNHHLETAWVATYTHGRGGRVLGINSEMDALPGIGHACEHNLVGISGVAVAVAAKAAMERLNIDGKVVLLGTPGPGPHHFISLTNCLAFSFITVKYQGHTAHAGLSPWEGKNALDAAVLAYNNVSILPQQIKPTHRVHGIFEGNNWAPNIIPDQATMKWIVRAPTTSEMEDTRRRVTACFEAAALASGCKVQITATPTINEVTDLVLIIVPGDELADVALKCYGAIDYEWGIKNASTDFRRFQINHTNHFFQAIPTIPNGGNHTPGFTEAARSQVSHDACLVVSKALAAVGMRVLTDEAFFQKVCVMRRSGEDTFEED